MIREPVLDDGVAKGVTKAQDPKLICGLAERHLTFVIV